VNKNVKFIPVDHDPFAADDRSSQGIPTTEPQKEIWAAINQGPEVSLAYNESIAMDLSGPLDVQRLRTAVSHLPRFHDALQATFSSDGNYLHFNDSLSLDFATVDLRHKADVAAAVAAEKLGETLLPFDLQNGPLVRLKLLILAQESHLLLISGHHIILDGWSFAVLVKDLFHFYRQLSQGQVPAKTKIHSLSEYARHRSKETNEKDLDYWASKFSTIPVLDLPTKGSRPPRRSFGAQVYFQRFDANLISACKAESRRQNSSFANYILAAFSLALQQISNQNDVVIGLPAAGQAIYNCSELVGHCVNLLPLRFKMQPDQSWQDYLQECRKTFFSDWEHNQITFGHLLQRLAINRDPSRIPLVPVVFNIDTKIPPKDLTMDLLTADYSINPRQFESFELFINCSDTPTTFEVCCQYNTDLFDEGVMYTLFSGLERILRQSLEQPQAALREFSICDESSIESVNNNPQDYPSHESLSSLIATQIMQHPERIALIDDNRQYSYMQLRKAVDAYSAKLADLGVAPDTLIGVCLPRQSELVIALLAIMERGATYVPLDPTFPRARLAMIAADAGITMCLVMPQTEADAPDGIKLVSIAAWPSSSAGTSALVPVPHNTARLAYVMFTSGSTGRPKGVMISQGALANFLQGMADTIAYDSSQPLLAVTTASFDISILELFMPLIKGGSVVVASSDAAKDGYQLQELIKKHRIRILQATPSGWKILLLAGFQPDPGFTAICGGEPLPRSLIRDLLAQQMIVWNAYGPTEATVWATAQQIKDPDAPIMVGKALPNYETWVLDQAGRIQPFGCKGELALGGLGLAAGYFGRPDLSAERFIFAKKARRLYLTGDVARMHKDGTIEIFGRNDAQVKVRGYRIEMDEIKKALEGLPEVQEAVVVICNDRQSEPSLISYGRLRTPGEVTQTDVLRALKKTLPQYMIPQQFIILQEFPLLPNGKIDRNSLPDPFQSDAALSDSPFVPLSTSHEVLLKLWQTTLKTERAFGHDDFFTRGGHSLLAMQLIAKLNQELGSNLRMHHLLEHSTLAGLAAILPQSTAVQRPIAARATSDRRLSLAQRRMWFVESAEERTLVHNLPGAWRLRGHLDPKVFNDAFNLLLQRHEALRMVILTKGGEASQVVTNQSFNLPIIDLTAVANPDTRCSELMQKAARTHMPIEQFPLFCTALYRISADEHMFFFMPHHIIWDGWCFDILLEDLAACYLAVSQGSPLPPQLTTTYGDYSTWQIENINSPEMDIHLEYWKETFKNLPEPLELPQDLPRPAQFNQKAGVVSLFLEAEETTAIDLFCQQHGVTPYMLILAAYSLALHRYSGQEDIVIGSPVRGRQKVELEKMLGVFINIVPLRIQVHERQSFKDFLQQIRQTLSGAFAHDELPFEQLFAKLNVKRDQSRTALYSAILSYQDGSGRMLHWGSLALEQVLVHSPITPTDLFCWVKKGQTRIEIGLDYYLGLWHQETARSFLQLLRTILKAGLTNPGELLTKTPSLAIDAWQEQCLSQGPLTRPEEPYGSLISYLMAASATRPDAIAISFRSRQLSYHNLWSLAHRLAQGLLNQGIKPGEFVGIALERSEDLVVALLGTWIAGGAYLPLDPQYPKERLAMMIEDSGTRIVLSDEDLLGSLPTVVGVKNLAFTDVMAQDGLTQPTIVTASTPAYVIYTSGSTGKPKGVVISQGAALNFMRSIQEAIPFAEHCQTLAITTISFDISVLELFVTLARGGTIHLAQSQDAMDGKRLRNYLETQGINLLQATPVTWRLILESEWQGSPSLLALIGGEALPVDLAERLIPKVKTLYNVYGPTEATVWATYSAINATNTAITIGKALPYYHTYILDRTLKPCALGMPGDLYIAGPSLATGYHGLSALTAERFIQAPWNSQLRLYDTGDRARLLGTGQLQYLGRRDTQIKLRGYRIELEEIERRLLDQNGIQRAVVIVREDQPGDQRLVAYVISSASVETKSLIKALSGFLPRYMLPNNVVQLSDLPLTANGKIDRKKLPVPELDTAKNDGRIEPRTETERIVAKIWMDLLNIPKVYIDDNFFDLGGHSLLAIEAIQKMRKATFREILVRDILLNSLAQMAASIDLRLVDHIA